MSDRPYKNSSDEKLAENLQVLRQQRENIEDMIGLTVAEINHRKADAYKAFKMEQVRRLTATIEAGVEESLKHNLFEPMGEV